MLLTKAAARHRDASGNVCAELGQAIESFVSAGPGQSEVGDQAAWLLLNRFQKVPELSACCTTLAHKLVQKLSGSVPWPTPPAYYASAHEQTAHRIKIEIAARKTLTTALSTLARISTELLGTAAMLVAQNKARFNPIGVVAPAIGELRALLDVATAGDTSMEWRKTLSASVATGLNAPPPTYGSQQHGSVKVPALSGDELTAVLGVLVDDDADAAATGAATISGASADRFPTAALITAVNKLVSDESRRAAVLAEAAWPRMLLQLNSRPDATPSNHYHPAYGRPSAAQGQSTSRIDTVVGLYVLLGSFDEAATVSPSYREQLVNTVTSSALQSTRLAPRDAATAAISLKPKLNAAGRKHPAYRKLLQVGLAALRTATAAPATPLKDWKITPSLGCNCHVCQRAVAILTNPLLDNGSITGRDAIFGSHLSGVLERAAKKPNSGFTFRQVSSRAARQNGHVQITKDPAGRTPVAQLRGMEQQRIQREALCPRCASSRRSRTMSPLQTRRSPSPTCTRTRRCSPRCNRATRMPMPSSRSWRRRRRRLQRWPRRSMIRRERRSVLRLAHQRRRVTRLHPARRCRRRALASFAGLEASSPRSSERRSRRPWRRRMLLSSRCGGTSTIVYSAAGEGLPGRQWHASSPRHRAPPHSVTQGQLAITPSHRCSPPLAGAALDEPRGALRDATWP